MGKIRLYNGGDALIDDNMYEYLSQWRWYSVKDGNTSYAYRYVNKYGEKPIRVSMHRVVIDAPYGVEVDHIDHNGLNNQKNNLRLCTHQQNQANQRFERKYKYVGVFKAQNGLLGARIRANGKQHFLGYYKTIEEAAMAYNRASVRFHGENAYINVIQ